jgi:hypothetical protein
MNWKLYVLVSNYRNYSPICISINGITYYFILYELTTTLELQLLCWGESHPDPRQCNIIVSFEQLFNILSSTIYSPTSPNRCYANTQRTQVLASEENNAQEAYTGNNRCYVNALNPVNPRINSSEYCCYTNALGPENCCYPNALGPVNQHINSSKK